MKLYRRMSVEEFLKLQMGQKVRAYNVDHSAYNESKGICFFGEEVLALDFKRNIGLQLGKLIDTNDNSSQSLQIFLDMIEKYNSAERSQMISFLPSEFLSEYVSFASKDVMVEFETNENADVRSGKAAYRNYMVTEYSMLEYDRKVLTPTRCVFGVREYEEPKWEELMEFDSVTDLLSKIIKNNDYRLNKATNVKYLSALSDKSKDEMWRYEKKVEGDSEKHILSYMNPKDESVKYRLALVHKKGQPWITKERSKNRPECWDTFYDRCMDVSPQNIEKFLATAALVAEFPQLLETFSLSLDNDVLLTGKKGNWGTVLDVSKYFFICQDGKIDLRGYKQPDFSTVLHNVERTISDVER